MEADVSVANTDLWCVCALCVFLQKVTYVGCYIDADDRVFPIQLDYSTAGGSSAELFNNCANTAQNERGGFCIEHQSYCMFANSYLSPGQFTDQMKKKGSAQCKNMAGCVSPPGFPYQIGAGSCYQMSCYKLQEKDTAYYSPSLCFGGNDAANAVWGKKMSGLGCFDLTTLIPTIAPFNTAWRVTGTYIFQSDLGKYQWCMYIDGDAVLYVGGIAAITSTGSKTTTCSTGSRNANAGDMVDIMISGNAAATGAFFQKVWVVADYQGLDRIGLFCGGGKCGAVGPCSFCGSAGYCCNYCATGQLCDVAGCDGLGIEGLGDGICTSKGMKGDLQTLPGCQGRGPGP
jgi:hypothetical protein